MNKAFLVQIHLSYKKHNKINQNNWTRIFESRERDRDEGEKKEENHQVYIIPNRVMYDNLFMSKLDIAHASATVPAGVPI